MRLYDYDCSWRRAYTSPAAVHVQHAFCSLLRNACVIWASAMTARRPRPPHRSAHRSPLLGYLLAAGSDRGLDRTPQAARGDTRTSIFFDLSDVPRRHAASVRVSVAAHSVKGMDQALWAEELARKLLEV